MQEEKAISYLLNYLSEHLDSTVWEILRDEDEIVVRPKEKEANAGFKLKLSAVLSKAKQGKEEAYMQEAAQQLVEMANASKKKKELRGNENRIFPVLRSASHPKEKLGIRFIHRDHTAESIIFYALDLGRTYVLIDEQVLKESMYTEADVREFAIKNLKKLDTSYKTDEVAGNHFYFFSQNDGYAASRVLNEELLIFMRSKITGDMGVAIPHQDVLIIADILNETGYKILSKMNMDFCVKGNVPISPLPFVFTDNVGLEPIMIMSNPGAAPTPVLKNKKL